MTYSIEKLLSELRKVYAVHFKVIIKTNIFQGFI